MDGEGILLVSDVDTNTLLLSQKFKNCSKQIPVGVHSPFFALDYNNQLKWSPINQDNNVYIKEGCSVLSFDVEKQQTFVKPGMH